MARLVHCLTVKGDDDITPNDAMVSAGEARGDLMPESSIQQREQEA